MLKGVNRIFVFLIALVLVVGVVSAWDVNIAKLNGNSILSNYSEKVKSFSYETVNITCGEINGSWYSLDGGITKRDLSCNEGTLLLSNSSDWSREGDNNWIIYVKDINGTTKNSSVSFWVDSIYPQISVLIPSKNPFYTNQTTFSISARLYEANWADLVTPIIFYVYDPFNHENQNFPPINSINNISTQLYNIYSIDGTYPYNLTTNDTMGHLNWTSGSIIIDTKEPTYSNIQTSNNTYAPGKTYQFNITWNDATAGVSNVWVNFSGTIIPVTQNNSGIFTFTKTDLAAGNYTYSWYANDYAGNMNTTGNLIYTVEKATTTCYLIGNNATYPEKINVTASCDNPQGTFNLYRNDSNVTSENSQLVNLAVGTYLYKVNMSETSNYTAYSEEKTLEVYQGQGQVSLTINNIVGNFSGEFPQQNIPIFANLANGEGNISVFMNGILLSNTTSSYSNLSNLIVGYYNVTVLYSGNVNYSAANLTYWINVTDTIAPTITLASPLDNRAFAFDNNNVTFNFNSSDASGVADCTIFLNGMANQSGNTSTFTINNLGAGAYNWNVNCSDVHGHSNISETRYFTVLSNFTDASGYDYTNLTNESDISNVLPFYVNNSYGMINWTEAINFSSGFDWSQFIDITNLRIYINGSQSELDKSAILTFYNVNLTQPNVTKDGLEYCSSTSCYDYNQSSGILIINISGAGEYIVKESFVIPSSSSSSSSGGGSSGNGNNYCETNWTCTEWGACEYGAQTRTCDYPVNYCEPETEKPIEVQSCTMPSGLSNDSEPLNETEMGAGAGITGGFIGTLRSGIGLISIIFVALIAAVGIGVGLYRRYR